MKLYVFQVNNGSTLTFDTELAVQTVLDLKHAIQAKYKIAIQHQVLVVNGGECMVAERRVCSYSAGTETNPIFLFNKEMILCDRAPTIPKTTFSIENEMELKVEESLMMPAVFHTVASRTQLALEMQEVAKKLCSFCERLVHDEHLQHQGWAAIMANLDDCTLSYQKLLLKFDTAYTNYQQDFEDIKLKLTKLGTAVSVMAKIPLLDCLTQPSYRESLEKSSTPNPRTTDEEDGETSTRSAILCPGDGQKNGKPLSASGEMSSQASSSPQDRLKSSLIAAQQEEEESPERGATPFVNVTLLDWINVQDRPNDVESVVRKCFDSINRLDSRIIQPFLSECRETITKLDNQNMKAIKGLEDRLYALDQMIASCNKLVNEQKELAQGFHANQKRAENLKDTSVLPDLCLSHANQLMIMLTNHRKLLDIKQKCTTAKQELANNLQVRLKWCCYVMLHADQDGEKLQALLRLLTELLERVRVVEALSTVPQMYCLAVVEVVRRKMFIGHYRQWANALVKDGKNLYEAEKAKRETFGKLFRKSFLRNRLFRGLDSWPSSSFCTRKPRKFDFELPDISLSDLQYLKSCCPSEVQPYLRVPTLCDFKPLNHHVEVLHQLVQAAQSVDEMSRTITDLLNEQKVSWSQNAQRSNVLTPRSESTAQTTSTSTKTLTTLSLKAPDCQPLSLPAPLEDLSPDSIDAQTFDFETIGHPNMDPVLHQGSLDLDSLAESPESDFMSAVNEFVIEENLMSPNPISDPTSPEMMVESLYSSVINAIDSKRIQDTTTLEKENSKIAALKLSADRYQSAAEESQNNLRKVKEDLYHFRGLVLKEQRDFGFSLKTTTIEVRNILNSIRYRHEEELRETQQANLQSLKDDHEKQLLTLTEELECNRKIVRDVQRAMLELEGLVERKEKEISQLESERERSVQELQNLHKRTVRDLEEKIVKQSEELKAVLLSKDELAGQLENLHIEIERGQQRIKQEMENAEKIRLQELEDQLNQQHVAELESVRRDKQSALDVLAQENLVKLKELMDSHSAKLKECEGRLKDLEARVAELGDARCKLEVELALKDAEIEDVRLQYEEARSSNEEVLKAEMTAQTAALQTQTDTLNQQLQQKNEEYEVGLAELRALMRLEKDHCISELVDRHEEESTLLRHEFSALKQKSQDAEKDCEERVQKIHQDFESQLHALRKVKEDELKAFQVKEQDLRSVVGDLQAENTLLSGRLEQERTEAQQRAERQKEEAVQAALQEALRDFRLQKEEIEKRLLGKMELLENQLRDRQSTETVASSVEVGVDASSEFPRDSGQWSEEKASLLAKLELLERTKNEEMQNVKTSLIAEQQTNFNTVLTRERLKKEQIVYELTEKLNNVMQQQEKDKGLIETLSEDRATILQEKKQLEEELNRLRNTVLVSSSYFPPNPTPIVTEAHGACGPAHADVLSPSVPDSERLASMAAFKDEERVESAVEASMMTVQDNPMLSEEKQRILILERTLHMKEEENKRLSQRLMSQSMSSVSSRHSEKIAIRDFQVGDLVLIILDERHDNYVLFTVGPTLYFLHSESLTALDLKPATGATRRPWVLGKVMEKEYCQAKKAQNRFKVPLGTKFYRVKAVPWNKKV
ncbi:RB1-inducible coiled-coil protein 1 [Triplophysa rosa]|uniref:RB1-inducible coiled-coil protein 1 n=1 Tax=Triplophysa rosa TaxID=992332 RepID=A0A9W7WAQ4_TRIRA|nr:RB1-inducible coiled-coil protein 1 [Triplophysa rosa]XP_057178595.1 RB1-inducible coiled-coil protein 1 [Triplophysa rosa]KAI7792360.1 putative RB1-inducible coiled-coil protein 1 [Triplophysa rosa]